MKDNLNIEELFKTKFEGFESDVDPGLWNNISQNINTSAGTGTATGGMSALFKTLLISGGIVAASLTAVYISYDEDGRTSDEVVSTSEDNQTENTEVIVKDSVIIADVENDPIIIKHKEEIEEQLNNKQYDDEVDENLVNQFIENQNNNSESNDQSVTDSNQESSSANTTSEESGTNNSGEETNETVQPNEVAYPTGRMEYSPLGGTAPVAISFKSNAKNFTSVKWNFGDGSVATGQNTKHTFARPGEYTVVMKVIGEGNIYEESKVVIIRSVSSIDNIPNVITPNGDRINDIFSVSTTEIKTFFISIRDVNGNAIFESNDPEFEWDGTNMSGDKVESGNYIYTIIAEGEDGSIFKIPGQLYVRY